MLTPPLPKNRSRSPFLTRRAKWTKTAIPEFSNQQTKKAVPIVLHSRANTQPLRPWKHPSALLPSSDKNLKKAIKLNAMKDSDPKASPKADSLLAIWFPVVSLVERRTFWLRWGVRTRKKRWRWCSRFDLRWRCSFPIHQHKTRLPTERNIGLALFKVCFLVFPLGASSWLPVLLAFKLGEWRDFGSEDDEGRAKRGLFLDFRVIFPWQRVRDCYSRGKE